MSIIIYYNCKYLKTNHSRISVYNRKIVEGLILNSFRYAKHITLDQTVNSALVKTIFNKLNPQYFDPIDARELVDEYFEAYHRTLNEVKTFENSESILIIIIFRCYTEQ